MSTLKAKIELIEHRDATLVIRKKDYRATCEDLGIDITWEKLNELESRFKAEIMNKLPEDHEYTEIEIVTPNFKDFIPLGSDDREVTGQEEDE